MDKFQKAITAATMIVGLLGAICTTTSTIINQVAETSANVKQLKGDQNK